jgi:predicted 3-demethylubiquinone-9 3-methyltransferase (glyoxalase superfamily)
MGKITPFLWFDGEAEEAMNFYLSVFPNAKAIDVSRSGEAGPDGTAKVMSVTFDLDGQRFIGLNGGPHYTFSPAISFFVSCDTQEEVDHYWEKLGEGGDPTAQQCGWLKDRFGVSWQIVPKVLGQLLGDKDRAKAGRAMNAMLEMRKLDIAGLRRAYEGQSR